MKKEKHSLYDFTRKSVVGALYRVGASFTMDAVYLSTAAAITYCAAEGVDGLESLARGFSDFVGNLDVGKLLRVTTAVVGINFLDYKFDITERLDRASQRLQNRISGKLRSKK